MSQTKPTVDDYLMSAWQVLSPAHDKRAEGIQFPRGFWPDLARLATELALNGETAEQLACREQQARENWEGDWAAIIPEEHNGLKSRRRASKKVVAEDLLKEISF